MNFWLYPAHSDFSDGMIQAAYAAPFNVWRFMDLANTNDATDVTVVDLQRGNWRYLNGAWTPQYRVPLHRLVQIANVWQKRGWYCLPHKLDSDATRYYCERLIESSQRKPIIEISNECWNAQFSQHHYAEANGGWVEWLVSRARDVRGIVGDSAEIVVSGQFWSAERTAPLFVAASGIADAVAVAPYYGRQLTDEPMTADEIHDYCVNEIEDEMTTLIMTYVEAARIHGVELLAYEGNYHGQKQPQYADSVQCGQTNHLLWQTWERLGGGIYCPYALASQQLWGGVRIGEDGVYRRLAGYDGLVG